MCISRAIYLLTAIIAWVALILQFWLLDRQLGAAGASLGEALWRFFGYFTILTNLLVALAATQIVTNSTYLRPGPQLQLSLVAAIVLVGLVYSFALRSVWQPKGLQAVADHALHDATPVLFALAWLTGDRRVLNWRDAGWTLLYPGLYCAYALTRGALDGWYPYYFLDATKLSPANLALNIAILSLLVYIIALALVALNRFVAARRLVAH